MKSKEYEGSCELCGRWKWRSFHHLIPRTCHTNKWFKKAYTKAELHRGIMVCRDCHHYIHEAYPEKELGRNFNTLEALRSDEKIAKFIVFVRKKK